MLDFGRVSTRTSKGDIQMRRLIGIKVPLTQSRLTAGTVCWVGAEPDTHGQLQPGLFPIIAMPLPVQPEMPEGVTSEFVKLAVDRYGEVLRVVEDCQDRTLPDFDLLLVSEEAYCRVHGGDGEFISANWYQVLDIVEGGGDIKAALRANCPGGAPMPFEPVNKTYDVVDVGGNHGRAIVEYSREDPSLWWWFFGDKKMPPKLIVAWYYSG